MPAASRNANRKRRARRNITLLTRAVRSETLARAKVQTLFLAVLAHFGGEIALTQGDVSGVVDKLSSLNYAIEPSATIPGEFTVRLVTLTEAGAQVTDQTTGSEPTQPAVDPSPDGITDDDTIVEIKTSQPVEAVA